MEVSAGDNPCEYRLLFSEALPEGFEFYHLGTALRSEAAPAPAEQEHRLLLGYAFSGDARGVIVALVNGEIDDSAAEEFGNIIACRWLSRQDPSIDLMLSPPTRITRDSLERMIQGAALAARAEYRLLSPEGTPLASLTALILAGPTANVSAPREELEHHV